MSYTCRKRSLTFETIAAKLVCSAVCFWHSCVVSFPVVVTIALYSSFALSTFLFTHKRCSAKNTKLYVQKVPCPYKILFFTPQHPEHSAPHSHTHTQNSNLDPDCGVTTNQFFDYLGSACDPMANYDIVAFELVSSSSQCASRM